MPLACWIQARRPRGYAHLAEGLFFERQAGTYTVASSMLCFEDLLCVVLALARLLIFLACCCGGTLSVSLGTMHSRIVTMFWFNLGV